jgi:hypothetical protein
MSEKRTPCGVFVAAKQSRETSVLIIMSACPSARSHETSCVHWTGFVKFHIVELY